MKRIYKILFLVYLLVVLRLTVFRPDTLSDYAVNFLPIVALVKVYKTATLWQFLYLFLGNIGWFVPFGILVPLIWKNMRFLMVLLGGAAFSLVIELTQLLFRKGVCELDDLLLNTIGAALGYGIYWVFKKWKRK